MSIVDVRRQEFRRTIPFWTQPWDLATLPGEAEPRRTPQIAFGIDSDARRGLIVTSNSLTDTVSIAHVTAPFTTAANRVTVGDHPFGVVIDERAGTAYVAMNGSGRIDVIDLARRRVTRSIPGLVGPTKLALDERTGTLYAGNFDRTGTDHAIAVIDARSGAIRHRIPVDANSRPTFDPGAGRIYAASFVTGRIAVIDAASHAITDWIETGSTPHGVAVDPGRNLLYTPNLTRNTVTIIDRTTLQVLATEPVPNTPLGIATDPSTGWTYISARDASTLTALRPKP